MPSDGSGEVAADYSAIEGTPVEGDEAAGEAGSVEQTDSSVYC